ncbi:hypothetical protein HD554DRAFT_2020905 [Boletus coccyginus]|nr:hypothetical protein HD554DRAFT_2020905 [Boletus coccyginus]
MALDFLSAPGQFTLFSCLCYILICSVASSVNAERAFLDGQLQVNHLQHCIGLQSFKAKVAMDSWYSIPLLPDIKILQA